MGIVVCLALLLGAVALLPKPFSIDRTNQTANSVLPTTIRRITPLVLTLVGLWNIAWYWWRYAGTFWATSALIAGLLLLLAALILSEQRFSKVSAIVVQQRVLNTLRPLIFIGLSAGFLLYAVTIIQLNLGIPIIGG